MGFSFNISWGKDKEAKNATQKNKRQSESVNPPAPERVTMQQNKLRDAADEARDPNNPSWTALRRIYEKTVTDGHYMSHRETSINMVVAEPFAVSTNETDNEDLTRLFKRPWFAKWVEIMFDTEMWGYNLAEFGYMDENGEFMDVDEFPRANYYPFNKNIIVDETDTEGIPYSDDKTNPTNLFLIELGKWNSIGKLETISREVIWKMFARSDWSALAGRFGLPFLVIDTPAEGKELQGIKYGASNFGRSQNIVGDFNGRIPTLIEPKNNGSGYLVFDKKARFCNEEISKVMNGQTGTSDNQAWSGTADVHEDVLDDWHFSRLRRYTNIINYKLIPFLIHHGYPLDGATFRFLALDEDRKKTTGANGDEGEKETDLGKPQAALRSPW